MKIFPSVAATPSPHWARVVFYLLLSATFSIFLSTPRILNKISDGSLFKDDGWNATFEKSENILAPLTQYPPENNAAKRVFRLTVPLIIFALGTPPPVVIYCIQLLLGLVLLFLFYKICLRFLHWRDSLFFALGLPFLYFGRSAWVDLSGWFDTFAFFFLLLGVYTKSWGWKTILFAAAFWTDERAILAFPALLLWENRIPLFNSNWAGLVSKYNALLVLPALLYFIGRAILALHCGLETPRADAGFPVLGKTLLTFGLAEISFFEGFWICIFLLVVTLIEDKKHLLLFLCLSLIATQSVISHMVIDVTRSGAYWFPFVLFTLYGIKIKENFPINMTTISFATLMATILIPGFYVLNGIQYLNGVHEEFLLWFFGKL